MMPGVGQTVQSGEEYRIFLVDVALPNLKPQPLLITQNLGVPGAQTMLDSVAFLPPV